MLTYSLYALSRVSLIIFEWSR